MTDTTTKPRKLVSIDVALDRLGHVSGRSKVHELINAGRLRSVRLGKRRLIDDSSIDELIEQLLAEDEAARAAGIVSIQGQAARAAAHAKQRERR